MPGPAPKDASQRARRNAPAFGEWKDLPELDRTYLPDLDGDGWSKRTLAWWRGLQGDPITQTFGSSEIAQAVEVAHLFELAVAKDGARLLGEVRQWLNILGFTPKGKRDLRYRVVDERIREGNGGGNLVAMPSRRGTG